MIPLTGARTAAGSFNGGGCGVRRTFDALDRVQRIENGLGHFTTMSYDANSNVIEVDAPGAKSSATADVERRLTRMSYDGRDLPWATIEGQGGHQRTTIQEFDPNGNLRRSVTPSGTEQVDGRWLARWPDRGPDEARHATVFDYDADNLMIRRHQPWGAVTDDDRFSQNDNRYVQDFERDQRGRIMSVNAQYDYNPNQTLVRLNDFDPQRPSGQENRTTRIEVDAAERQTLVNEIWSRGRDTTFRYDANGNVTRRQTDGRFSPTTEDPDRYVDGRTTAFTYDPLDRETRTVVCRTPVNECTPADTGARVTTSEWFDSHERSLTVKPNGVRETRFWFNDGRIA